MKKVAVAISSAVLCALLLQPVGAKDPDRRQDREVATGQKDDEQRPERKPREEREQPREGRDDKRDRRRDDETQAGQRERRERAPPPDRHGGAEQAARMAQRLNGGGRVLSVTPDGDAWQVRLLKGGEVRSFLIPGD